MVSSRQHENSAAIFTLFGDLEPDGSQVAWQPCRSSPLNLPRIGAIPVTALQLWPELGIGISQFQHVITPFMES